MQKKNNIKNKLQSKFLKPKNHPIIPLKILLS